MMPRRFHGFVLGMASSALTMLVFCLASPISAQSLGDIVAGPGRGESLASQVGLPAVDLAPPQRVQLAPRAVADVGANRRQRLGGIFRERHGCRWYRFWGCS